MQVLKQQACVLVKQAEQGCLQARTRGAAGARPEAEGASGRTQKVHQTAEGASDRPQAEGASGAKLQTKG